MSKFNTKLDSSNKVDSSTIVNFSITVNEECFRKTADLAKEEQLTADAEHYTYEKDQEFYRDRKKIEDYLTKKIENDKYVFKFPLMNDGIDVSLREKRITDALRSVSPVKIPETKLIKFRGIMIRRYEFAHGKLLTDIKPAIISKHRKHIAKQLAEFLYVIGKSDPTEIRDLKPSPNEKPGYLYGWTQDDIWQNFMLDEKTMNLTFLIDWENAKFGDFTQSLRVSSHNWDKFGYRGIIVDLLAEYSKMYFGADKNKTVK